MALARTPARWLAAMLVAFALLVASPRAASADTVAAPYGMMVMLQVRMPRGEVTCTGFMIGPHTIATAAHCLYSPAFGGWASSAFVTPGIDGLNAPFATEWVTSFAVSPTWVQTQDPEADYAAITLDSDALGTATGWFDLAAPTNYQLATGRFATAGYGTSTQYGTLWRMPRPQPQPLVDYDGDFLAYVWGTSAGESGAPIFEPTPSGERYRAVGLLKGAFGAKNDRVEFAQRITGEILDFYREQIARPPAAPVERTITTMFTSPADVAVRVTSPVTRANATSVLQSSPDQLLWTTVASASTDARGVATYMITPAETRYYRVVVLGVGTGRVGQGFVIAANAAPATPATTAATGRGTFAGTPAYSSSRVAFAIFQGGTAAEFTAALKGARASAAWVQDARGEWYLYVVDAAAVNDPFLRAFPGGFVVATSMALVAA